MNKRIALKLMFISIILTIFLQGKHVLAANLGVNIEFDGKKIEMLSETPEMEWNIDKLFQGEASEATLVINSVGSKEVKADIQLEIENNKELEEHITLKITNSKTGEMVYDGKYSEFKQTSTKIPSKQTNIFKVVIGLPTEIENSVKGENIKIKFKLVAKGEKKTSNSTNQITENATELSETEQQNQNEITTDIIKPIKKSKSITIYVVFAIMMCILIVLVIAFFKTKV